jgi:hypothetical protein
VSTAEGVLPRHSQGTVRYEVDNLGRRLVFVDWDNGMEVLVFPHEIEMLAEERLRGSTESRHERLAGLECAPLAYRTAA